MTTCPSCQATVGPDDRFCMQCGYQLSPRSCHHCGASLQAGARFCTACGTAVAPTDADAAGWVVDGEWHRAPGEFVRQIPITQMKSAFARLFPGVDLDAFFEGSLVGRVVEALTAKTIRVPAGSVGAVMADGVCQRLLPPGEQTTVDWLRGLTSMLVGDPAHAAAALADRLAGSPRLSFYLVDRRPIPLVFTREVSRNGALTTVHGRTLLSLGTHRDAMTAFIQEVVRERESLSAQDVHGRFQGDVEQAITDALASTGGDLAAARREAMKALTSQFTARTGMGFEVTLSPRRTLHRLDLRLGQGVASAPTSCASCGGEVAFGQKFCTHCGAPQPAPQPAAEGSLFTQDGVQAELDVVMSVEGSNTPTSPEDVLQRTAQRVLREKPWSEVVSTEGFAALEQALAQAATEALTALGLHLVDLDLIDVRSPTGAWVLNARAEMAKARDQAMVGREWLTLREDTLDVEELSLAMVLREQRVHREHAFTRRQAAVEDARRHAALDRAEQQLASEARAAGHADALKAGTEAQARAMQAAAHRAELARQQQTLEGELQRQQASDEAAVEQLRREARLAELRGLAELEAESSQREHQQRLERIQSMSGRTEAEILALQATELASQEQGAAFAEALGKLADGDAARREREQANAHRDDIKDMAKTAVESHARVATARAAAGTSCTNCGAPLHPNAAFCGACGTPTAGTGSPRS